MIFFRKISAAYSPKTTYKQIFAKNLHQNYIHKEGRTKKEEPANENPIRYLVTSTRHIVRQFYTFLCNIR